MTEAQTQAIQQDAEREAFEAVISGPPYECDIRRYPDDKDRYTFPGCYVDIKVDLAWWMWQAAIKWKNKP